MHEVTPGGVGVRRHLRPEDAHASERGAMLVLFALTLPLMLALGSLVVSIGNWYVHAKHLQTQVDAAAFAAGTKFTGCFAEPHDITNASIRAQALLYAGDMNRDPSTTNLQFQEPGDVHVVLNSSRYWKDGDPVDDVSLSSTLDNTMTYQGDPFPPPDDPSDPCETRTLDVKATDDEIPDVWGWLKFAPDAKKRARVEIRKVEASYILPFAVPELEPGAVAAIFVDEDAPPEDDVLAAVEIDQNPNPDASIANLNVYEGPVEGIELSSRDNVSVIILVSRSDIHVPDLNDPSLVAICTQVGVGCFSGAGNEDGLALVHGYSTGAAPAARRVDVSGCDGTDNLSGPYFSNTGDCEIFVSADLDFGAGGGAQARLHTSSSCGGSGTDMTNSGSTWDASTTLPAPSTSTGPVPLTISWRTGPGGWNCFSGGTVARPYVANRKSGPVEYLSLEAWDKNGSPFPNAYSIPKEPTMQPFTFHVTVGLRPPLHQSSLADQPALIRLASDDNPSLTQSIDCDIDSYAYPEPFDTLVKDAAEIAHGCVTPYSVNQELDCSDYGFGDLPPNPVPELMVDAPDCAQSKNGTVAALRHGLAFRLENPCTPNYWPDTPITQDKVQDLIDTFGNDPRMVLLVVTEYGAFGGTGSQIVPVKYIAGFYLAGWDYSNSTQGCGDPDGPGPLHGNDPHPLYGTAYQATKPQLDDGDLWGYYVTPVIAGSGGAADDELCAFDHLGACIAVLTE